MAFNSGTYLLFLPLVMILYWGLRRVWQQNLLLLGASYIFYAAWDWRFLSLIWFSTAVNYIAGLLLGRLQASRRRMAVLLLALLANLLLLGFFKYYGFFIDSAHDLLASLGIAASFPVLNLALPVGISFYTFQTIAYIADVHRRRLEPARNLLNFALFVVFFPQLVAGPIERARRLLPQIAQPRRLDADQIETGLILLLLGLFKKVVIADVAASLIVPGVFENPSAEEALTVIAAMYLFALQVYGDFSGYSDIARGSARLLGIELMENFNQPYFAQTISEFWQRWHISLSAWLRDYVFFPVSRALLKRSVPAGAAYAAATLTTMLLAGLWHGAAWTFVLWGGLLGMMMIVSRWMTGWGLRWRKHEQRRIRWGMAVLRAVLTFHLLLLAWVLFRSPTLPVAQDVYRVMLELFQFGPGVDVVATLWPVLVLYLVSFGLDAAQVWAGEHTFTRRLPAAVRPVLYTSAIVMLVIFAANPYVEFIYFQF